MLKQKWLDLMVKLDTQKEVDKLVCFLADYDKARNVHVYGLTVHYQQKTWVEEDA